MKNVFIVIKGLLVVCTVLFNMGCIYATDIHSLIGKDVIVINDNVGKYAFTEYALKKKSFEEKYRYKEIVKGSILKVIDLIDFKGKNSMLSVAVKVSHNNMVVVLNFPYKYKTTEACYDIYYEEWMFDEMINGILLYAYSPQNKSDNTRYHSQERIDFDKVIREIDKNEIQTVGRPKDDFAAFEKYCHEMREAFLNGKAYEYYKKIGINVDSIAAKYGGKMIYFDETHTIASCRYKDEENPRFEKCPWYQENGSSFRKDFIGVADSALCKGIVRKWKYETQKKDDSPIRFYLEFTKRWYKGELYEETVYVPIEGLNEERLADFILDYAKYHELGEIRKQETIASWDNMMGLEAREMCYEEAKQKYGEKIAKFVKNGQVQFGWTSDMCSLARCTEPYQIGSVLTPVGTLDYFDYINTHKIYYFKEDKLVGIYDYSGAYNWVQEFQYYMRKIKKALR